MRHWGHRLRPKLSALVPWRLPCAVFVVFLVLYATTLRPDVLPADSGEFQWVATTADVAHPPGYPLYTILGLAFSRVPLGPSPAWRVNVLSAITAAATLALIFSTTRHLTDSILGGLVAALTLGSATTFWATSTKASIRPLTAFFTALCLYTVVRHASEVQRERSGDRHLTLFSLAFSLGLTHHPSLIFPGAIFLLYLMLVDPELLRQPGRWLKPLIALLPSLLIYVYLPIRGAPDLATPSGFLDYVLARGFRGDMFALGLRNRLVLLPTLLCFQFNRVLLLGMLLGMLLLLWRDRKLALLLVGSFLAHTIVTLTYDAPQTVEYEIPAYVSLALLTGVAIGHVLDLGTRISISGSQQAGHEAAGAGERPVLFVIGRGVGVIVLVAALINLVVRFPSYGSLSRSHDTRSYVDALLHDAPEGAIILSNWHWFTPLRYVQQIEGARPDVSVEYVAPRGEPLAQTWAQAIQDEISQRPVVVVRYFEHTYSSLPYTFEPLGEAFLVRSERRTDLPSDLNPVDVGLSEQIEILGYRVTAQQIRPVEPLTLTLAWSPTEALASDVALFAQLIGPDGGLWSTAEDQRHRLDTLSMGEIVVDRFVVYPHLQASTQDHTLVVGAYAIGASAGGRLQTPEGADDIPLESVRLHPSMTRPVTQHPRFLSYVGGARLIGVDYETGTRAGVRTYLHWAGPGELTQASLKGASGAPVGTFRVPPLKRGQYATVAIDHPDPPGQLVVETEKDGPWNPFRRSTVRLPSPSPSERYVPFGDGLVLTDASSPTDSLQRGTEATLCLRFRGQRPLQRDYIVSTSFTGLNSDGTWAWRSSHDTVPALGAIPTLKWIRGSSVLDPHRMQVPEDAPDVPVAGSLLIYDHFTQRSLPSLDERLGSVVELGTWRVSE